jgi:hypothetical protein
MGSSEHYPFYNLYLKTEANAVSDTSRVAKTHLGNTSHNIYKMKYGQSHKLSEYDSLYSRHSVVIQ